jgi:hypothetical protein
MTKRMFIMLGGIVLLVVVLGLGFFMHIRNLMAAAPKPAPQIVSTITAKSSSWQPQLKSVGTLSAVHGVDISSEVAGQVRATPKPCIIADALNAGRCDSVWYRMRFERLDRVAGSRRPLLYGFKNIG